MSDQLTKKEIQKKVKDIEAIYGKYLIKLNKLKKIQNEVIDKFIEELK